MPNSPVNELPAGRKWAAVLLPVVAYAALAVWSTWPLATSLSGALPIGTEDVATVPLLNLWTMWWNADRAAAGFRGYWNAPIFRPVPNAFAFSEPQPPTLVVAPLVWWSETPTVAYNAYLLLSLTLNGWSAFRLFRRLELSWPTAISGGAAVLMLPFVHWQLGVLQLAPLYGVIWTIHALFNFGVEPRVRQGVFVGLAFAWTYLLCAYHGLFLLLLLIPAAPWLLGRNLWNWRAWVKLLPGAAACLLVAAPVLVAQKSAIQDPDFERGHDLIMALSAEPGDYTVPAWPELTRLRDLSTEERRIHWKLSPGNLKWMLATVGVVGGLCVSGLRRWTAFCLTAGVLAFLLSQGPKFHLGSLVPYQFLIEHFPGMAQVRNVFRFALFVQLFAAMAAAVGLELVSPKRLSQLWKWLCRSSKQQQTSDQNLVESTQQRTPLPLDGGGAGGGGVFAVSSDAHPLIPSPSPAGGEGRKSTFWLCHLIPFLLGGVVALEIRPTSQRLFPMPSLAENQGWIDWLKTRTEPHDVIACVPFPPGAEVGQYLDTTVWMYWQTFHGRRMVNGYSGFFPESFRELKGLMQSFPDRASVDRLRASGVRYCVVRRAAGARERIARDANLAKTLLWKFGDDEAEIDIYQVFP